MKKLFILFIAVAGFVGKSYAQPVSTNASATIVTPLLLSQGTNELQFGIINPGVDGGTLVIHPDGSAPTPSGTVTLIAGKPRTPADFDVIGTPDATFTITHSDGPITLTSPSSKTMTAGNFTTTYLTPLNVGTIGNGGTVTFTVGATLTVPAGADLDAGVYTNTGDLTVTVNYN